MRPSETKVRIICFKIWRVESISVFKRLRIFLPNKCGNAHFGYVADFWARTAELISISVAVTWMMIWARSAEFSRDVNSGSIEYNVAQKRELKSLVTQIFTLS